MDELKQSGNLGGLNADGHNQIAERAEQVRSTPKVPQSPHGNGRLCAGSLNIIPEILERAAQVVEQRNL